MGSLLALVSLVVAASAQQTTVNVGMFFRMTSGDGGDMGDYWRAVAAGGLLAVKHFNERNSTIISEFGNLSGCDVQFEPVLLDTGSLGATAVEQYLRKFQEADVDFDLIVGAARSACSEPIAMLAGVEGIPQVSYWSTSPTLEDRSSYPYFLRSIPSDSATAYAAATYFNSLGYWAVGCLYLNDAYGQGYSESFMSHSAGLNISVTAKSFAEGDSASIDIALQTMKDSGLVVFIAIFFDNDLEYVMTKAKSLGITGPGFLWIFADGFSGAALQNADLDLAGSGRLGPSGAKYGWPQYEAMMNSSWPEQDANIDYFNNYLTAMRPWFNLSEGFFAANAPIDVEFYAYDATVAQALAVCGAQMAGLELTGANIKSKLEKSSFDGVSGPVIFDADTGNRNMYTGTYLLSNIYATDDDSLGYTTISSQWDPAAGWEESVPFVYADGATDSPVQGTTVNVGMFFRMSSGDGDDMGDYWRAVAAGGLLAVKHFNERDASIISEFGELPNCDIQFNPKFFDTGSTGTTAVEQYQRKFDDSALEFDLIVGAARSACSEPIAMLAGGEEIPQVSYWSTSPTLEDRSSYPYFLRSIPSDSATAYAAATYFDSLGYTYVGCVYLNDEYGQGYAESFMSHSAGFGVSVTAKSFSEGDSASIDIALQAIKDSGLVVIMAIFFDNDLEYVMTKAKSLGITGPGFLWIFADGFSSTALQNADLDLAGSGRLGPSGAKYGWPQYEAMINSSWPEQDANIDYFNNYLTAMRPWFNLSEGFFAANAPIDVEFYAYDATVAQALAACEAQEAGLELTGANIKSKLEDSDFDGVTGPVIFDADTGNRNMYTGTYLLSNIYATDDDSLGYTTISSQWDPAAGWEESVPFVYADGATDSPVQGTTVNVGMFFRMSSGDGDDMGDYWRAVAAGGLLAVKHFNERDASIISEFGELPNCDIQFNPKFFDTGSTGTTAVEQYQRKFEDSALEFDLIVGAARSACSEPIAMLAGGEEIPQVSYWSTSPTLEDRSSYPYFLRSIPSDAATAYAAATYFDSLGYTYVGCVYLNDEYGQGYSGAFMSYAAGLGIEVSEKGFSEGDSASIDIALQAMKDSGLNVFMAIFFDNDLEYVMTKAKSLGITGPGFLWIFADGFSGTALQNADLDIAGSGRLAVSGAKYGWPQYEAMINSSWPEQDANIGYFNNYFTQMRPWFNLSEGFFAANAPIDVEFYAYDATVAQALAACGAQAAGLELTGANIKSKLEDSNFDGVTGPVIFDPDTGNRNMYTGTYLLSNIYATDDDSLGYTTISSQWDPAAGWEESVPFVYSDGSETAPSSLAKCDPGFYNSADDGSCIECPEGLFASGTQVRDSCTECSAGTYGPHTGLSKCLECSWGTVAVNKGATLCVPCPTGAICPNGDTIQVTEGGWRTGTDSDTIYECPLPAACIGGNGTSLCLEGHKGPKCAVCKPEYFLSEFTGTCKFCEQSESGIVAVLLVMLAVAAVAFAVALVIAVKKMAAADDVKSDKLRKNAKRAAHLWDVAKFKGERAWSGECDAKPTRDVITAPLRRALHSLLGGVPNHYFGQLDTRYHLPRTIRHFSGHHGVSDTALSLSGVLPHWRFLDGAIRTLLTVDHSAPDAPRLLAQLMPIECLARYSHHTHLMTVTLIPLGFIAFVLMVGGMLKSGSSGRQVCQHAAIMVAFIVLPTTSTAIFRTFHCQSFDNGYGNFLVSDLSINCDGAGHGGMIVFAVLMVLIYPVGMPMSFLYMLSKNREAINPPGCEFEVRCGQVTLNVKEDPYTYRTCVFYRSSLRSRSATPTRY